MVFVLEIGKGLLKVVSEFTFCSGRMPYEVSLGHFFALIAQCSSFGSLSGTL